MSFKYYEDPILGKGRAQVTGGTGGGGGTEYVGGNRISIGGETISFVNSADIVNVTGTSVTLQPDTAYKIYATSQAITLNANPPAAGKWAYDGHLEIFTAGTGYVVTGSNVVLANALEPDAVNNCTVRFHDGIAIIAVEDHIAGYIVVNGSTSGEGSLYYGITTSTNDYVAFDASLNGTTIPLAGAVAEGEKHIVGNGYTETTLTGAVDCGTSKFTVANLSLDEVQITGGVMTLGDAYIPSGSTVAVSGGGLAVEKVTGAGESSVIDLGGGRVTHTALTAVVASGCTFTNGRGGDGGAFAFGGGKAGSNSLFKDCLFTGNGSTSIDYGGALLVTNNAGPVNLENCIISGNTNTSVNGRGAGICVNNGGKLNLVSCTVKGNGGTGGDICAIVSSSLVNISDSDIALVSLVTGATVAFFGKNTVNKVGPANSNTSGTVTLTSGAILDLTGNSNATPIAPGGGITFEPGGATVLYSSGAVSGSYMMDNVKLPAGAKLTNTAVVSGHLDPASTDEVIISGVTVSGATAGRGGGFSNGTTIATLTDCAFYDNVGTVNTNGVYVGGGTVTLINCTFGSGQNIRVQAGDLICSGTITTLSTIGVPSETYLRFKAGTTLDLRNNTTSTSVITAQNTGHIAVEGDCQIITSAGSTVSIAGGTYTKINNDGTTE